MTLNCKKVLHESIKNTKLLAVSSLLFWAGEGYAQQQVVQLPEKEITLKEVFKQIEKQTQLSVDYNHSKVSELMGKKVVLSDGDVNSVLEKALAGTGLTYSFEGDHIIISVAQAQTPSRGKKKTVSGTVVDTKGEPIIGATIQEKGTTNGIVTDFDGNFTLTVAEGAMLSVAYLGYQTQELAAKGTDLKIKLKEDTEVLDEVVVIGYGTTSKRKTTAAITSVDSEALSKTPVPDVTQGLAGRAPGLIITQAGGGIGTTSSISIRGGGTPLFVIDDVVSETRDFENLNPEDIAQMTVLKDASATAVYGSRAANGIILVTTKQGISGKINVNYNFNYNLSQPAYLPEKLDAYNTRLYQNIARVNDGMAPVVSEEDLQKYKDGSDPYNFPNTDWLDLCMRNFAPEQRHSLSIRGGSENIKVYTGLGYYDQESIYRTNSVNMQRYNFRTNIVATVKEIGLKITSGVDAYLWDMMEPNTHQGSGSWVIWGHVMQKEPYLLGYNQYGQIFSGTTDNPLVDISSEGGYFKQHRSSVRGNMALDWDAPFLAGLKFKALGSYTLVNDRSKSWQKTPNSYDLEGNPNEVSKPNLEKKTFYHRNFTTQFFGEYNQTFNYTHTVGALLGFEASGSDYDESTLGRKEYLLNIDQITTGPVGNAYNSSREGVGYRRASFIGRVKYDYAAKYMADFSMRYDGSDYFPKDNRWGLFFAGSLAWAISEEGFMKSLKDNHVFDLLKLRASYGEIGLDGSVDFRNEDSRLNRYEYLPSYNYTDRGGYIGGAFYPGFSEGGLVSKDITWYTSKSMNVGLDFASLDNRLSGTLEYFRVITTGYLTSPSKSGYTDPLGTNLPRIVSDGEEIRQGGEFILAWEDKIGELKYNVSGNLTFYNTQWNLNPDESETDLKNPYKRSSQAGRYWGKGYECEGYYQDMNDVMNSPKRPESVNLAAGDLKYADFNGDGIIDANDEHRIGTGSSPRMNYGINLGLEYKGWFMNMLWQGAGSYDIENGVRQDAKMEVKYDFNEDFWTPQNTNAQYPRLRSSFSYVGGNNNVASDYWLIDGKYIRLKYLSVGYDLKNKLLKKVAWLTKCSVSLAGNNLLTFSPAKKFGMDPELGDGHLFNYPISRTYSISINLGF